MKHLPNELLYLLKIYNFVTKEIGIDHARSRSEEIREYIRQADFLNAYPTVKEYLSEDKSIDDILTYIQRNEKTYSLLGEWKDGEISSLFKSKGLEGAAFGFVGGFDIDIDKEGNAYFTLPYKTCISQKIVLLDSDCVSAIHVDEILWFEFYRSKEFYCIEIFDDDCNTVKVTFSDFKAEKSFSRGEPLCEGVKSSFEAVSRLSDFIFEKNLYDPSLLSEGERNMLSVASFFAFVCGRECKFDITDIISLFNEYSIGKGEKLLKAYGECDVEKKRLSIQKKIKRLLMSKKSASLVNDIFEKLVNTQKNTPENI